MPDVDPRAKEVSVSADELSVLLADGRRVSVPLTWFPRLVAGLLRGAPSASR